jgi:hypothetical protein
MIRIFIIGVMTLALAGCGSSALSSFSFLETKEKPIARDIMPARFKQEIIATVPSVVADHRGIREAYYSDPAVDPALNTYVSCVRFNARNAAGDYEGAKEYAVYYYNGHLNQFAAAPPERCRGAGYKPFPELENSCPGGKCAASAISPRAAW